MYIAIAGNIGSGKTTLLKLILFAYLYHIYGKRSAAFVYGNCWAISVQNIPGDKASADLYFKRFQ